MPKYVYSIFFASERSGDVKVGTFYGYIGQTQNLAEAKKIAKKEADERGWPVEINRSYMKKDGRMAPWKHIARIEPHRVGHRDKNPSENAGWTRVKAIRIRRNSRGTATHIDIRR